MTTQNKPMNRAGVLAAAARLLCVWPTDQDVAAMMSSQFGERHGWIFGRAGSVDGITYVLVQKPVPFSALKAEVGITRQDWERACHERYGNDNDAEIDGDGDFAAMHRGELQEKGDDTGDATSVATSLCQKGHLFAYISTVHPRCAAGNQLCPNCLADTLKQAHQIMDSLLGEDPSAP